MAMTGISLIALVVLATVGLGVAGLIFWGIWAILNRSDGDRHSDN